MRAPGRVNLIGGHVDYNEGWVLPAAIEPSLWLCAGRGDGSTLRLELLDLDWSGELAIDRLPAPVPQRRDGAGPSDYPGGIAWALLQAGHSPGGLQVAIGSDIPIGGGVSSSAALEVALLLAWQALGDIELAGLEMAQLGMKCENEYLGLGSGIMDQYAIVHGRRDEALLIDCRHLQHRRVPVDTGLVLLVADTGVRRRLVGSGFNDRKAECVQAADLLRGRLMPELVTLRDLPPERLDEACALLPPPLDGRVRHFITECQRVKDGAAALERGELESLRQAMIGSHVSSRDDYHTTIEELDVLAEAAWEAAGCWGARLSGGGFGGCVLAVVESGAARELRERMRKAFARRFGREPSFLESGIGPGAEVVESSLC